MRKLLLCLTLASCAPAHANAPYTTYIPPPEVVWTPTPEVEEQLGYLEYSNRMTHGGEADVWVEQEFYSSEGPITIRVKSTWNRACQPQGFLCPDEIEVISVPEGWIAYPSSAIVDEEDQLSLL